MKYIFSLAFICIFLGSCSSGSGNNASQEIQEKALTQEEGQGVFDTMFQNYQTTLLEVPKSGEFDFEATLNVDGDKNRLEKFSLYTFQEIFQSLSFRFYGNYDFTRGDSPSLSSNIKIFLNQGNTGIGDLDGEIQIPQSGALLYKISNLNKKILHFFGIDEEISRSLLEEFEKKKGLLQESPEGGTLLKEILEVLKKDDTKGPLVKNTAEEEKRIIDAFLASKTIEVSSGTLLKNGSHRIFIRANMEHFTKFLNDTAEILGGENSGKDFSKDAERLSRFFRLEGTLDIKGNRIIDSSLYGVLRFHKKIEEGIESEEDIILKIRGSFPNPQRLDFDIDTSFWANSQPDNILRARVQGLIK